MNSNQRPKVVLVTGGSSGLGKATCEFLSSKNFRVYGTSRNPSTSNTEFTLLKMDLNNPESIALAVKELLLKEGRIDILINNAGMGITGPIEETEDKAIKQLFQTNYFGPLEVIKQVLPTMKQQKSGQIINITSIAAFMGLPFRGIYSASKAALQITTEAYRMELKAFNIQMCNLAPGDYATDIASGRLTVTPDKKSDYYKAYTNTLNLMNDHVDHGRKPSEVAEKIYKIISYSAPKPHFLVGSQLQKFSIAIKKILPQKWFEQLLLKHYKL